MRHISADFIFPIFSLPIENGIITIDNDGVIIDICSPSDARKPKTDVQHHKGIICPGFINTHCHLELSYLKDQITENAGMTGFITQFIDKRNLFSSEQIQKAIETAEAEMIKNGIVAVGDISNNNSTFRQKAKGNLRYHTFIEIFNLDETKAEDALNIGLSLENELEQLEETFKVRQNCSIVPHAPYTMSERLLKLINEEAMNNNNIISIHNQECESESELFISRSGKMMDMFNQMGINPNFIRHTKTNSLRSTLPYIKDASKILFVHNTYTSRQDIQYIKSEIKEWNFEVYFCTCPNANLYIENKLPDYSNFIDEEVHLTIGTDSLASNKSLSVLDELKTISKHNPNIDLQSLLKWATKNGADFLKLNKLGTIEKGKQPGLNLLTNINLDKLQITPETQVVKLV